MFASYAQHQSSAEELANMKEDMCLIFGLKEKIGALADALRIFEVSQSDTFWVQIVDV